MRFITGKNTEYELVFIQKSNDYRRLFLQNNDFIKCLIRIMLICFYSYKNSSEKTAFKVYYITEGVNAKGKIQMDGNQRDVTIKNVNAGDKIVLWVNSKGDTGAQFTNNDKGDAFTGAVAVNPSAAGIGTPLPGKANETDMYPIELTAYSDVVVIRETVGGYILHKIEIGALQGIDNVEAVKAEKFYRDGQLIIRKNGVEYNALGAKL